MGQGVEAVSFSLPKSWVKLCLKNLKLFNKNELTACVET